ncbi:helix-turn-helix domain-containing protein [Ligilactobacillus agilis]|uniref:helix-turn-helix domain-containing protein n=1 Tax=Ligilactobacillus agilis TaxID=1601 RepID=UPI00067F028A|nr:helix-turn-helix transcriptional regulator [Ligilactobacillus agilis]
MEKPTVLDRVKDLAKKQGISIVELEEKLGFGRNSLYAWKNKMPSNDKLIKVADFFHVSVDYLLGREEVKTPSSIEFKDLLGQSMTFEGRELTDEEKVMMIEVFKAYLKTKK